MVHKFYTIRRKDWKKRVIKKINSSPSIVRALKGFLEEYIFYSLNEWELKKRLKRIKEFSCGTVRELVNARKDEFNKNFIKETENWRK